MSRGFVKEDDQEEAPVIPPRAALPAGITNYVTPAGERELLQEKKDLEEERKNRDGESETELRRQATVIDGKMNLLNERISSARIIQLSEQPENEVRFGALVKFKMNGNTQEFQIVGVDQADVKKKKIAFVAPIAKALTGNKVGGKTEFNLGAETRTIEVLAIDYPSE
jgi:transcription elongation factor GreB